VQGEALAVPWGCVVNPRKSKTEKRETFLRRNLTAEEYKALSAPGSAEFPSGQTPKPRRARAAKPLPLNWLLGCGQKELEDFELARLAEMSDLRKQVLENLDRMIDAMSQAAMAAWFKEQDRQSLKHAIENEETPEEWAKRMIRERGRSAEELLPLPTLPPGVAHLAAALRYQERNLAENKCSVCPEPLDRNSVRFCTKHLGMKRNRAQQKKGLSDPGSREYLYSGELSESTQGRTPGTLASLAMNREKKTRALLAEAGIRPESAAVSLNAAVEALQKIMPRSKADALTQAELFEKAGVITNTTGRKALAKLLSAGEIQRTGKGIKASPFRYFQKQAEQ